MNKPFINFRKKLKTLIIWIVSIVVTTLITILITQIVTKQKKQIRITNITASKCLNMCIVDTIGENYFNPKNIQLHYSDILIYNSGTEPIFSNDFVKEYPLSFILTHPSEKRIDELVISIAVLTNQKYPHRVRSITSDNKQIISFYPNLLSPGDTAVIRIILTDRLTPLISAEGELSNGNLNTKIKVRNASLFSLIDTINNLKSELRILYFFIIFILSVSFLASIHKSYLAFEDIKMIYNKSWLKYAFLIKFALLDLLVFSFLIFTIII